MQTLVSQLKIKATMTYLHELLTQYTVVHVLVLYISERCKKAIMVHPTVTCRQIELMTMSRTCQTGVCRKWHLAFNRKLARSWAKDRASCKTEPQVCFYFLSILLSVDHPYFALACFVCSPLYHFILKGYCCRCFGFAGLSSMTYMHLENQREWVKFADTH